MIKQQERVIRKGDYYEMQTYEQSMMMISKTKKEQSHNSNPNIPVNQHLLTDIPSWANARNAFFRQQPLQSYSNIPLQHLLDQLAAIDQRHDTLTDQQRNQIDTLTQEILNFANSQQIQLNSLPLSTNSLQNAKNSPSHHIPITLTASYSILALTQRISQLQSLDFPDLIALEHKLEIMLGQKKPLQSLELSHMDEKEKEELNNLYNHLNSLSIMNNTQRVIDGVFVNEGKHVEMQGWLSKMEAVQGLNKDLLVELEQDQEIIGRLEGNFEQNIKQVREILTDLKSQK